MQHPTGLTRRANAFLRHLIVEAAWIAVRKDPDLLSCYLRLGRRMRKTKAIIRISRKLLNRIRCVWIRRTPYIIAASEQNRE